MRRAASGGFAARRRCRRPARGPVEVPHGGPRADADGSRRDQGQRDDAGGDGHGVREAAGRLRVDPAPIPDNRVEERLGDAVLELVRLQLRFLLRVAEERHLDEHGRHVRRDEHAERRLLNRVRAHLDAPPQFFLDEHRERRRLAQVPGLRHVPQDQMDVARAAAEHRHGPALRVLHHLARLGAEAVEAEVEHLRALDVPVRRRVRVQADEQVRLVVVGDRRALVVRHDAVVVAREEHPDAKPGVEHAPQSPGHVQHQVLFEHAARAPCALLVAAMPGIDHDGRDARRLRGSRPGASGPPGRPAAEPRGAAGRGGRDRSGRPVGGEAGAPAAVSSITSLDDAASIGTVAARNVPNALSRAMTRVAGSEAVTDSTSPPPALIDPASRPSASKRTSRRLGSCTTVYAARGAMSIATASAARRVPAGR